MSNNPEVVLETLIAEAERLFPLTFPPADFPGMVWRSDTWGYQRANTTGIRAGKAAFRTHPKDGAERFHPRLEYAVKAYLVFAAPGSSKAVSVLGGVRGLWGVLLKEGVHPARFRWNCITQAALDEVERHLLDYYKLKPNSAVIYMMALENFLNWLRVEGVLASGLELKRTLSIQTPRSLSKSDKEARESRLVPREVLTELAGFYQTASEPDHRLLICAVGLLLVAGFRISELLTLPADGLVSEVVNGREKWYIRYWQRKPGKGRRLEENKRWLSPMAAELARRLWDEILALTSHAREAARLLEADPTVVCIPWLPKNAEYVSADDLHRAFGWQSKVSRLTVLSAAGIEGVLPASVGLSPLPNRAKVWPRREVEALLLARRGPLLTHISGTNKRQSLSETLLICPDQFLDRRKRSSEVLVRRLSNSAVDHFLDGKQGISPLPEHLSANSHGFRHWLNTVANKAGMSVFLISVWMQRANIEHNLFYLHDPLDIAEITRENLRDRRYIGKGAEQIYALPDEEREEQIDSITMAHIAATVICGLDFTHAECPEEKLCELCVYGFYDPQNPHTRRALTARLRSVEKNLEHLNGLKAKGIPIHERQFEEANEILAEIRARLARSHPLVQIEAAPRPSSRVQMGVIS